MSIGKLNRRVLFESENRSADGAGGFTRTWSTIATVWGALTHKTGKEAVVAMQQTNTALFNLKIRHCTDIDASVRATIAGEVYNVRNGFNKDQRQIYLDLTVAKGVAA